MISIHNEVKRARKINVGIINHKTLEMISTFYSHCGGSLISNSSADLMS